MSKLIIRSYKPENGYYGEDKTILLDSFLAISADVMINQQERRNGETTYYCLEDEVEKNNYCFVVSQDPELIKDLKMWQTNKKIDPKRTGDLFEETQDFQSITIKDLLPQMENNQADFHLEIKGKDLAFRLVTGQKARKLVKNIEDYFEEMENTQEYSIVRPRMK